MVGDRRVEIDARLLGELDPELVAQNAGAHFGDLAFPQIAELERTERHADQAVHGQPEMLEHPLDLAVLALAQTHGDPGVGALLAVESRLDPRVVDPVDRDPVAQGVELGLPDGPMGAHAVAAQPAGRGQLQHPREPAVVGEEQQALGVDVEPSDSDDPRQIRRQGVENRRPPLGIASGGDEAADLMEQEQAGALGRGEPLAVDPHVVFVGHIVGGALERLAVDRDAPLGDPGLGLAAGA